MGPDPGRHLERGEHDYPPRPILPLNTRHVPRARHRSSQSVNDARLTAWRPHTSLDSISDEDSHITPQSTATSPAKVAPYPESHMSVEKDDSSMLLTALAGQERRVMELREELKKAEEDLSMLKERWMAREVGRKREELVSQSAPLRPLTAVTSLARSAHLSIQDENQGYVLEHPREDPRSATRSQPRRFEGGKHVRALSLLSTTQLEKRDNTRSPALLKSVPLRPQPRTPLKVSTSLEDTKTTTAEPSGRREDFVNTGKQLVDDLKDGLWTFIEDLKQATVGDEAVSEARARQALNTPIRSGFEAVACSVVDSKCTDLPIRLDQTGRKHLRSPKKHKAEMEQYDKPAFVPTNVIDDDWDNWDSPTPKTTSNVSDSADQISPRTSTSSETILEKSSTLAFDRLSWPSLSQISPSRLTKTASSLMKELENSINEPRSIAIAELAT